MQQALSGSRQACNAATFHLKPRKDSGEFDNKPKQTVPLMPFSRYSFLNSSRLYTVAYTCTGHAGRLNAALTSPGLTGRAYQGRSTALTTYHCGVS